MAQSTCQDFVVVKYISDQKKKKKDSAEIISQKKKKPTKISS